MLCFEHISLKLGAGSRKPDSNMSDIELSVAAGRALFPTSKIRYNRWAVLFRSAHPINVLFRQRGKIHHKHENRDCWIRCCGFGGWGFIFPPSPF